ncbi:NAD(P)/FAD-dependent oxidoreductase [Lysinibacillus pakistanensis]|uniref:Aminoacetone oxidase family FAD-binding enzyme n=1 Tax=Lysinibacillus pakistanensis TaxID=759811 RepID=A0AAX3WUZ9_9BACI|nr:NAD(P)/FAD-dependent oxidoreductase [Lysinibacillus pakistanensis]MDM5229961.1 NAD(P)/FAD-dependent oxidoreductase [Lysinibacillus pakistanensis]QGG52776.1 aminoacetone oxidase family FAD-binding enzyme [Lysinibacillus pakistanensis]WHY45560.1 NAD(P)/FAD-dependent oxidoreductase [Lysinibacillus pakistanensis]WHY50568.1 NAD(P)/FAD-dependent oxidoreductase [Lysinibacillus pakistanensis]
MYDVIVIGGGPSGLMAAIAAGERKKKVLLVEKGNKLGKKLAISGGGRCNVTNRLPIEEIVKHIPGNGRFLYSPFTVYNNEDIIAFFEGLGVALKEEDHGRMFPMSNRAQDVVDALIRQLQRLHVEVRLNTPVSKLLMDEEKILGVRLADGLEVRSEAVIVAVGGKAVPQTGSTGDGYPWAERAGHTITTLFPTEVPVLSKEDFIQNRELQGLALREVAVSVLNKKGKVLVTHQMDMLFTHFGLSGPAILRCSQFIVKELMKTGYEPVTIRIQTLVHYNEETCLQYLNKLWKEDPKRAVKNVWKGIAPERWLLFLCERAGIDVQMTGTEIAQEKIRHLARLLVHFTMTVSGTQSLEKAFVTGGGISVKEIEPKTMASKKKNGLFFCGEILDIHGYTGGYNITSALVTGRIAGMNAGLK